jgi:hypothetical protein
LRYPESALRTIIATRYVTPLREGGSLPAIVEADDSGLYVVKFRGAGQGVKALVAELIAAGLARALGLLVPELVLIEVDAALGRNEPDDEIRDLLRASVGLNVALDYLPGAISFDPTVGPSPSPELASSIVWFDAFLTNVDRTARNTNLLCWHHRLYLIDHGAALYFHHDWGDARQKAHSPFAPIRDHVLLPFTADLAVADRQLRPKLNREVFQRVLAEIPDSWLTDEPALPTPDSRREAYADYLEARLDAAPIFLQEAVRARENVI